MTGGIHRAVAAGLLLAAPAVAQDRIDPVPKILERSGVEEKLDATLPLQLVFRDESGREVTLGSYFRPGRPVLLTLNYYRCPMLCTLELNGLVAGLKELSWTPGDEFEIVTVSIDPRETRELARGKKESYLSDYGRPAAAAGWHFLTGDAAAIEALTKAVGFSYTYDEETDQYAHPAVVVFAMPEGRVARYLYGVQFEPDTLRLALVEASRGRIGSALDRFILYCYHYDSNQGRYTLAAVEIMRIGAVLTVLVLGVLISGFWMQERKARRAA